MIQNYLHDTNLPTEYKLYILIEAVKRGNVRLVKCRMLWNSLTFEPRVDQKLIAVPNS